MYCGFIMTENNKGIRVLVVDDFENMRKRLGSVLEKLGMTVSEAENGVEAIELLHKEKFDMVFTDIVMPEMDGFELCEEIRKSKDLRNILIVVNSTHVDSNYIIKALRMGADDYISKPIEIGIVEKVIARITTPALISSDTDG